MDGHENDPKIIVSGLDIRELVPDLMILISEAVWCQGTNACRAMLQLIDDGDINIADFYRNNEYRIGSGFRMYVTQESFRKLVDPIVADILTLFFGEDNARTVLKDIKKTRFTEKET